jgi:hypothetical protein
MGLVAVGSFGGALFGGGTLFERDIAVLYLGQSESFARCLASGSWPLWNPYAGFGQPMLADPGQQVLYPPTWLNLLVSPETHYALYAAGHLLLAGLGVFLLARELRVSRPAATVAGLVWMLSGPLLSAVSLWQHFAGAAWIPWVLCAQERALRRRSVRASVIWGAALAGQLLTGSIDMTVLGLVPGALLAVRRVKRPAAARRLHRLVRIALPAAATVVGLTAALWIPARELLGRTMRAEQLDALQLFWSIHPLLLLQTQLPVLVQDLPLRMELRESLFGAVSPLLASIYLGAAAAPLVVAAFARRQRGLRWVLCLAGVIGALVAVGSHTPLPGLLTDLVPGLRLFRFPAKAMVLVALAWALLAGMGVHRLQQPLPRAAWRRGGAWLGVLLPVVGLFVLWAGSGSAASLLEPVPSGAEWAAFVRTLALRIGLAGLLAAGAGLVLVRRPLGPPAPLVAALLVVIDLAVAASGLNPTVPRPLLARPPETVRTLDGPPPPRILHFEYAGRIPDKGYRRNLFTLPPPALPNPLGRNGSHALGLNLSLAGTLPVRWGLSGSFGLEPVVVATRRHHELTYLLARSEETPAHRRLLQLGGVQHLLAFHDEGLEPLDEIASIPSPLVRPVRVFRVPDPLPRVFVVGGVRNPGSDASPGILLDPGFDPSREVLLTDTPSRPADPAHRGEARLLELGFDTVRVDVESSGPAHLVLLDAWDPGWRASVDGTPAPVRRANYAFRAVPVPGGRHLVELRYRPWSAVAGLVVSAATALALVFFLGVSARRRRAG